MIEDGLTLIEFFTLFGIAAGILFGLAIIFVLIAIFIEEADNKIKFWRLAWRKFRKWLMK